MNTFEQVRAELVGYLEAVGLAPITDPRNLTPPCVFVDVPSSIELVGRAGYRLTVPVFVIAAGPGNLDALSWAMSTTEQALGAFAGRASATGSFTLYPWQGQELAAYRLEVSASIPAP